MRIAVLLLATCILYGQAGKPGVTDPIKDPQQVPGKAHPGPIPRSTPQPSASTSTPASDRQQKPEKKTKKKQPSKEKVSQSER